ncbi:RimK family alpha-L-glutamate ligase [Bermanella sp. R86510]|uniref:ATP-grasp domain-containing protein n=1 Tax=unclassified Bermanella TaxID=2627862 RepID=UPI0037C8D539
MKLVSFDAYRSLNLGQIHYIKPELMNSHIDTIVASDGIVFPQYWQLNSLLYGLKKRIFPSAASYHIGHDKVEMTRCFQLVAPHHVPWTMVTANTLEDADKVWASMPFPFVAKIPKSSMGEGVFLIETRAQWQRYLEQTPVIYAQEYLPIDRDLRIVWVGDRIVAGYWRLQAEQGFYNNVSKGGMVEAGILPPEACALVEKLATQLDINHGGFDIAMVGNHPYVFEFNRLFGNQGQAGLQSKVDSAIEEYLAKSWGDDEPNKPTSPHWSKGSTLSKAG